MAGRVLLLSAPLGSGHLQAAKAIARACKELDPGCTVHVADLRGLLMRLVAAGYTALLSRAPSAYRGLYNAPVTRHTRALVRTPLLPAVRREVLRLKPTAIIATHPFPGLAAAHLRRQGRLDATVAMAVTDFVPHPLWVHPGADRYFTAPGEAPARLAALGVPADCISATGIPVRPEFMEAARTGALRSAGRHRHILVMGGGLGLGPLVEAVRSLAALPHPQLRVTVVCGTNEELRLEMTDLFGTDHRIRILGHTDGVHRLLAGADLLVTKPGGLSCSEAMACGLPMLLLQPLPGHEEENAAYLTRTGAAQVVDKVWVGRTAARLLLAEPEQLARMREASRLAGRPQAARQIANEIFMVSTQNRHAGATD